MISFPFNRHHTFRLSPRTESTPLDEERNFLTRIVGHPTKKPPPQDVDSNTHSRHRP